MAASGGTYTYWSRPTRWRGSVASVESKETLPSATTSALGQPVAELCRPDQLQPAASCERAQVTA